MFVVVFGFEYFYLAWFNSNESRLRLGGVLMDCAEQLCDNFVREHRYVLLCSVAALQAGPVL